MLLLFGAHQNRIARLSRVGRLLCMRAKCVCAAAAVIFQLRLA